MTGVLEDYVEAAKHQDMVYMMDTLDYGLRELLDIYMDAGAGEEDYGNRDIWTESEGDGKVVSRLCSHAPGEKRAERHDGGIYGTVLGWGADFPDPAGGEAAVFRRETECQKAGWNVAGTPWGIAEICASVLVWGWKRGVLKGAGGQYREGSEYCRIWAFHTYFPAPAPWSWFVRRNRRAANCIYCGRNQRGRIWAGDEQSRGIWKPCIF